MANHAAIRVETKPSADECVILDPPECTFTLRRVSGITDVCNFERTEIAVGSDALTSVLLSQYCLFLHGGRTDHLCLLAKTSSTYYSTTKDVSETKYLATL